MKTYRISIAFIGLIVFLGCTNSQTQKNKKEGLKDFADFPIGNSINLNYLTKDTVLLKLNKQHFNSITSGNNMKMRRIVDSNGVFNFDAVDRIVDFAQKNNMRLFGHTLIWHSSTPKFVLKLADNPKALNAFMKEYIHTYVSRYKGKIAGWDVVNEGMKTFGGGYRESIWYNTLGKDYIANAFIYAHEADPDAILFYNDFNIERDTAKLDSTLAMIADLKKQGVPISGLGYQMHTRMDIPDETIAYCLKKGAETGLQIHLSELDIIFNKHDDAWRSGHQIYDSITDEMLEAQKVKYKNLVKMYRSIVPKEQQFGITFWGFNDRYTWINGFFNLKDWPCLYDRNLQPKPAYYGFIEGLTED